MMEKMFRRLRRKLMLNPVLRGISRTETDSSHRQVCRCKACPLDAHTTPGRHPNACACVALRRNRSYDCVCAGGRAQEQNTERFQRIKRAKPLICVILPTKCLLTTP